MSELLIQQFDSEGYAVVEAVDDDMAIRVLRQLGAEHLRYCRYRLPVEKLGEFCDLRFGVERATYRKPPITDEQRRARKENMRRAIGERWKKGANHDNIQR